MPMSLRLRKIDSDEILFDYSPEEFQWWINGFDPSNQNAYAENLQLTVTIDFSSTQIYTERLKKQWRRRTKNGYLMICKRHIIGETNKCYKEKIYANISQENYRWHIGDNHIV